MERTKTAPLKTEGLRHPKAKMRERRSQNAQVQTANLDWHPQKVEGRRGKEGGEN
jgi:hypothetical protein